MIQIIILSNYQSTSIADDVVYEKWYYYDVRFQRVILMISLSNELKCKISNFQNIDLTLPTFMSVSFHSYDCNYI